MSYWSEKIKKAQEKFPFTERMKMWNKFVNEQKEKEKIVNEEK